jgi:hypothetical protein
MRASLGWFEDSVEKPACLMSGTGIKLRQRVVVFSKGCLKGLAAMLMIVRYITMPITGCQIVLFPNRNAFKWEKTLDKNKTFIYLSNDRSKNKMMRAGRCRMD